MILALTRIGHMTQKYIFNGFRQIHNIKRNWMRLHLKAAHDFMLVLRSNPNVGWMGIIVVELQSINIHQNHIGVFWYDRLPMAYAPSIQRSTRGKKNERNLLLNEIHKWTNICLCLVYVCLIPVVVKKYPYNPLFTQPLEFHKGVHLILLRYHFNPTTSSFHMHMH